MRRSFVILCCLLLFAGIFLPANAYVLQGPHILTLMVKNIGNARGLFVEQKLLFHDPEMEEKTIELSETLRYLFPNRFRSEIQAEGRHRLHVVSRGDSLTVVDGKITSSTQTRFDLYKDVLLYNSRMLLEKRLSALGLDISVSSLGRFQDQIVYVVGARYPDESAPQRWIDRERLIPVRWIITGRGGDVRGDMLEVRYLKWLKEGRIWYPGHVEMYQNDMLVREQKISRVAAAASFEKALFDIEQVKAANLDAETGSLEKPDTEKSNEVGKTIEYFRKIFE